VRQYPQVVVTFDRDQRLLACEMYVGLSIEMYEDGKTWVLSAAGAVAAENLADAYRPAGT
jgi:hypothetical protein